MNKQILENILSDQLQRFLSLSDNHVEREVETSDILKLKEALVITGVRRCGKSYLMKQIANKVINQANIAYIDLDDPRLISFESEEFELAHQIWQTNKKLSNKPLCIFLDEPQNVYGWERWAAFFAKLENHFLVITGSNSNMLSSDLSTFLTGRHREIQLLPLSFREILSKQAKQIKSKKEQKSFTQQKLSNTKLLEDYFLFGGFPRAHLDQDSSVLQQYFKDIIYKDIVPRRKGSSPRELIELGTNIMSNNTRLINKSKLGHELGIKQSRTVTNYIQSYKDAYLFYEMRRFDASLKKQTRSLPKFYSVDPALAAAVGFRILEDKSSALENFVALELLRQKYEIFYWTDPQSNWELDFIARKPQEKLQAFQVSLDINDPATLEREIRILQPLKKYLKIDELCLIVYDYPVASRLKNLSSKIKVISFFDWLKQ